VIFLEGCLFLPGRAPESLQIWVIFHDDSKEIMGKACSLATTQFLGAEHNAVNDSGKGELMSN